MRQQEERTQTLTHPVFAMPEIDMKLSDHTLSSRRLWSGEASAGRVRAAGLQRGRSHANRRYSRHAEANGQSTITNNRNFFGGKNCVNCKTPIFKTPMSQLPIPGHPEAPELHWRSAGPPELRELLNGPISRWAHRTIWFFYIFFGARWMGTKTRIHRDRFRHPKFGSICQS